MTMQEVRRNREERDAAQLALEQAYRETFTPGTRVYRVIGRREVLVEIVRANDVNACVVRNPETGREYWIAFESISRCVE
jgi:hypothetical protein